VHLSSHAWATCQDLKEIAKVNQQDCYYLYRLGVLRRKPMHVARLKQYPHATRKANNMPMVGKKEFSYGAAGMKAAKKAAKKTGKPMKMKAKKKK
jgi:hypothetical protein